MRRGRRLDFCGVSGDGPGMVSLLPEMICLRADAAAAAFDGHGGVRRLARVEGFAEGCVIATPAGGRAVEGLRVGDVVCAADGGTAVVRRVEARRFDGDALRRDPGHRAVVIGAGALGEGVPGVLLPGAMRRMPRSAASGRALAMVVGGTMARTALTPVSRARCRLVRPPMDGERAS